MADMLRTSKEALVEPNANFGVNAILRGAQLTLVGALRAFHNPELFRYNHYRQAAIAVCAGLALRLVIAVPEIIIRISLWISSFFVDLQGVTWDDDLVNGLRFLTESVLQVPVFLLSLMRYMTPTLDSLFMDSLAWVDRTYMQKHQGEDIDRLRATYAINLQLYSRGGAYSRTGGGSPSRGLWPFFARFGRRAGYSLLLYALSFLPIVGRVVFPAASFLTFNRAVGTTPAAAIFAVGILLPRHYLVVFLQSYFASRSLMRELLEPYFSRIHFTRDQKVRFFREREGVLFGFGVGFYLFLRIPLLGILIYGIAEASTAYFVTKITDPPPPPAASQGFAETQTHWTNKREFFHLPLERLDELNAAIEGDRKPQTAAPSQLASKRFT